MQRKSYCDRGVSAKLKIIYEQNAGYKIKPQTWRKLLSRFREEVDYPLDSDEFAQKVWFNAKKARIHSRIRVSSRVVRYSTVINSALAHLPGPITAKAFTDFLCERWKISPPTSTRYWFYKRLGCTGIQVGAKTILTDEMKVLIATKILTWKIEKESRANDKIIKAHT